MFTPDQVRAVAAALAAGNRDAFRALVQAHGPGVRAYLSAHVLRMDEVDDLAQEVFLAAYRQRAELAGVLDLGAWLRGVARNKALAHARASARRADAVERFRAELRSRVAAELDELAAAERTDTLDRLLGCIERLPDRLRRVVRAGLDGRKAQVLADELGVAPGTVYNLNSQAYHLLRQCQTRTTP